MWENNILLLNKPWWLRQWRNHLQCGRLGFDPWVGKIPCRRERLLIPVFWPGEFHGQRSLAGYSPWSRKELDRTEQLSLHFNSVSDLSSSSALGQLIWGWMLQNSSLSCLGQQPDHLGCLRPFFIWSLIFKNVCPHDDKMVPVTREGDPSSPF